MNDYLSDNLNLTSDDIDVYREDITSDKLDYDDREIIEVGDYVPEITSAEQIDQYNEMGILDIQYVTPQKIIAKKYTLKKW